MGNENRPSRPKQSEGVSIQPATHPKIQPPELHPRTTRSAYYNRLADCRKKPVLALSYAIPNWLKDYHVDLEEDKDEGMLIAEDGAISISVHRRPHERFLEPKSNDQIRVRLIQQLCNTKQWLPVFERPPTAQTIIIYDWDDTLLCTSYLNQLTDPQNTQDPEVLEKLRKLDLAVVSLLKESSPLGSNYVITNAMRGWVEFSAAKWLPSVLPLLDHFKIVSARSDYEQLYPGNYHQWKECAFLQIPQIGGTDSITNLVVLGDSMVEMDAAKTLKNCYSRACIKTIKFQDSPTPEELIKQLGLVTCKFQEICTAAKDMTIRLERRFGARD